MSLSANDPEADNHTRWDGSKKGFYEVYYLKWNDPAQQAAAWLRYTITAPVSGAPVFSVWGIFFDAAGSQRPIFIKQDLTAGTSEISRKNLDLRIGSSRLTHTEAQGILSDKNHSLSWDLHYEQNGIGLRHFPALLYKTPFPSTKFLAPYLSVPISGTFVVDGRSITLDHAPAHQAHIWGTDMAPAWVWGNCNTFEEDPTFCFEGLSAHGLTLLTFYWERRLYQTQSPLKWILNRSRAERNRWSFGASFGDLYFAGEITTRPEDIVDVRYVTPSGGERFCHNTKIADLQIRILQKKPGGWTVIRTFNARRSAAFETVGPLAGITAKFFNDTL